MNTDTQITTTAPGEPGKSTTGATEFARIADIHRMFGIGRGSLYALLRAKKIKSTLKRVTGAKSGCRLIEVQSVRDYILSDVDNGEAPSDISAVEAPETAILNERVQNLQKELAAISAVLAAQTPA